MIPTRFFSTLLLLFITAIIFNCKSDKKKEDKISEEIETIKEDKAPMIKIVTRAMEFDMPDTIPSGWNTFKYENLSQETHFFLMDKYPEGITIENTIAEVAPAFDKGMDLINNGKLEESYAEFAKLPEWFPKVVFSGGSGLIGPRSTSITTLKLDPGYYIIECYVKMPNGKFHTSMGMAKPVIVSATDSGMDEPISTIDVNISSTEGIIFDKNIDKGRQIFAVHFKDQIVHENFVGHDVNLVKIEDFATLSDIEAWMNWMDPKGLITPVPKGFKFMGGVNDSPAGTTGYFEVELKPGKYALVSEVPNSKSKGMLQTFEVLD